MIKVGIIILAILGLTDTALMWCCAAVNKDEVQ